MANVAQHFASGRPHLFKITAAANESFAHVDRVQLTEKTLTSQVSWNPSVVPRSSFIGPTNQVIQFRATPTFTPTPHAALDATTGDGLLNITFLPDDPVPQVNIPSVYTSDG